MAIRSCILDPAETQQCRGQIKQREPNTSSPSTRAPRPRPPESAKRDPRPTTARRRLPSSFPPPGTGSEDVLRRDCVGPVADRVADRVPAVPLLPGPRPLHVAPRRHPRPAAHPPLLLRLRHPHSAHPDRVIGIGFFWQDLECSVLLRVNCFRLRELWARVFPDLAGFMLYVIERAKKCLDFAATLYIIHLFICIVYGGWPASVTWWVVNIAGLAIMALLGEYLCIRRELKEIPISRLRA
ncbi:hypothetical protein SETIT_5G211600v2, partial [Setaria italica]